MADRKFTSPAVEDAIATLQRQIADPALRVLVENCLPNTLDTTVVPGAFDKLPDTYVVTGDIDAMWLRDSSAQVWPYLRLALKDARLRILLEGVIRRQTRMILLDPYANAFTRETTDPPLSWAAGDRTEHRPGVAERKWEIDSLCFPIRLAYGYWQATGRCGTVRRAMARGRGRDSAHLHRAAAQAVARAVQFPAQGRVTLRHAGAFGIRQPGAAERHDLQHVPPVGRCLHFSALRAGKSFRCQGSGQLAELAAHAAQDTALAARASALSDEVAQATAQHGRVKHPHHGEIWAYEVDGYGSQLLMDDANAPGLVSLAYLGICPTSDAVYQRTRAFALSDANPYFFRGTAAEGVGGPHIGLNSIWPMSIMYRAFTSTDDAEIRQCLRWLRDTTAGTGFMHESFNKDDPSKFTRSWFAWANTLFGELMMTLADQKPALLAAPLS